MFIEGFGISSYRSFGSDIQFIGPCEKVNFLIGQNNSGKSNVLRFLNDQFHKALRSVRGREGFNLSDLDRHLGENTGGIKLAFGLKRNGSLHKAIFESKNIPFEGNRTATLLNHILQFPEIALGSDTAWFIYEANLGQPLTISENWVTEIAQNRYIDSGASSTDGLYFRDWGNLASVANRSVRTHSPAMVQELLPYILGTISPVQRDVPTITIIQAIREIKNDSSEEKYNYNGLNIIPTLAKLERPDVGAEYDESKSKFETISQFVGEVVGRPDARLEIPASERTIQLRMDGKALPLENLGTGIHEVIILAIAATLLQDQIICIEEPEIHLHPLLQKKLIQYLDEHTSNQYFIATHSASMIDLQGAAVFHVQYDGKQSVITPALSSRERFSICVDLGYRASDILQTNCILWVEGPSDRIYLEHWLRTYDPELEEGVHYSIMFYGGRLLSHLSFDDKEVEEFISLRKINQNSAILIDSDREKKGLPMSPTKRRVRDEFDKGPGFAWITAGREIENYIPPEVMEVAVKEVHRQAVRLVSAGQYDHCYHFFKRNGEIQNEHIDKVKIARRVTQSNHELDALDLREKIRNTSRFIRQCNDFPVDSQAT